MPTNFPGSVDTLTNPTSGSLLTSPSHADQHINSNDAIEALETYALVHEIDYVQFTATVSPTATSSATANTVVTSSAKAYNGTTIVIIEFSCPDSRPDVASGAQMAISLWDGSTDLGRLAFIENPGATAPRHPIYAFRRLTPSNATHTYSIRAMVSTGTGYIGAGAGGAGVLLPGFIRITRAN